MSLQITKNAFRFMLSELKNRPFSWLGLTTVTALINFSFVAVHTFFITLLSMFASKQAVHTVVDTLHVIAQKYNLAFSYADLLGYCSFFAEHTLPVYVVSVLSLLYALFFCYTLYHLMSYAFVVVKNVLDATEKKPLSRFDNRIANHSLVWLLPALFLLGFVVGLLLLFIGGMSCALVDSLLCRFVSFVPFLVFTKIVIVLSLLSLFLLFIARFSFAGFILIDKQCSIIDACKKSNNLVKGNVLTTIFSSLLFVLLGMLCGLLITMLLSLLTMLVTSSPSVMNNVVNLSRIVRYVIPFEVLFFGSVYQQLKNKNK